MSTMYVGPSSQTANIAVQRFIDWNAHLQASKHLEAEGRPAQLTTGECLGATEECSAPLTFKTWLHLYGVRVIGPAGAGRSDIAERCKNIYKEAPRIYVLARSPFLDNPLNLLFMILPMAEERARGEFDGVVDSDPASYLARVLAIKVEILKSLDLEKLIDFNAAVTGILQSSGQPNPIDGIAALRIADMVSAVVAGLGLPPSTRAVLCPPDPTVQAIVLDKDESGMPFDLGSYPIAWMHFS